MDKQNNNFNSKNCPSSQKNNNNCDTKNKKSDPASVKQN